MSDQLATDESCEGKPGKVYPVVNRNRCEAKNGCVEVCPYDVFEIQDLSKADRSALTIIGKVKAWAHGNRQAFVVKPDDCRACLLCIEACPEDAIWLTANVVG